MSQNEITEEEYRQLIKELKERDFDLFYLSFNNNFLTKENVEKGLSLPDTTALQFNYTVNLMAGDLKQIIARIRRKKMNEHSMPDSKMKNSQMLVIGIYIAFAIAIAQVIASETQKYFINNSDPLSAFVLFVVIVLIFGVLIFALIKIFAPFRTFILKMYGAYNQN